MTTSLTITTPHGRCTLNQSYDGDFQTALCWEDDEFGLLTWTGGPASGEVLHRITRHEAFLSKVFGGAPPYGHVPEEYIVVLKDAFEDDMWTVPELIKGERDFSLPS